MVAMLLSLIDIRLEGRTVNTHESSLFTEVPRRVILRSWAFTLRSSRKYTLLGSPFAGPGPHSAHFGPLVMDTTLVPAIVRVRASRKGLFCGQATFGRSASKTEWVYGFKVALVVDPAGVITAFGLAEASSDERPIAEALIASDRYDAYLADKGFTGIEWERRWLEQYGALVAATP